MLQDKGLILSLFPFSCAHADCLSTETEEIMISLSLFPAFFLKLAIGYLEKHFERKSLFFLEFLVMSETKVSH